MGKIGQIINVNDTLYEVLGTMSVKNSEIKGTEYWKEKWGSDSAVSYTHLTLPTILLV